MRRSSIQTLICALSLTWAVACQVEPTPKCNTDEDCFSAEGENNVSYICDWEDSKSCLRACQSNDQCLSSQYCDPRPGTTQCSGSCTTATQTCDPVTNSCLDSCTSDTDCDTTDKNYVYCDTTAGVCRYGVCRYGTVTDGGGGGGGDPGGGD